ncbi:MAG: hypothetical protein MUF69_09775, partial [Desulfobacterota bacterium]|nr:hypothetical protein [Thermodesulfobacteriota bacterium]
MQDMIYAATEGGTVTISSGIFDETLTVDRNLTLRGVSPAETILQPGAAGQRVITVSAGHDLTLENLTVTNGQAPSMDPVGGGVYLAAGSLTLLNVHITGNVADYGGGVFQEGATGRVEAIDSLIQGNRAGIHGGGMYVRGSTSLTRTQVITNAAGSHGGGLHIAAGSAVITGGNFSGNQANTGNGGGLNLDNQLTVSGTQFQDNTAGDSGGAITQWNAGYTIVISGASFNNNSSKSKGGAAFIQSPLTLTDAHFNGNVTDSGGAGNAYGGGLYTASPATVTGCTFTGNQAKCLACSVTGGGGLSIALGAGDLSVSTVTGCTFEANYGWFGGGLSASYGTLNISRSVFKNNGGGYGAGLNATTVNGDHLLFQDNSAVNRGGGLSGSFVTLSTSRFLGNTAIGGGGIAVANGSASLTNVLLAQNNATAAGGGALRVENAPATLTHVTIARPARGSGSGINVTAGAALTIKNAILANYVTAIEATGGTATEDYNLFYDNGADGSGTIIAGGHSLTGLGPNLADPAGNDYHLTALSPAIGAGNDLGVLTDLDDRPRLGGRFDIGA